MSGTTATLLARSWESALLVNVDNSTLQRLMNNKDAMAALMSIEGFRNLNQEIETIINKSEAVKKQRRKPMTKSFPARKRKSFQTRKKSTRACASKFRISSSNSPPVCRYSCI